MRIDRCPIESDPEWQKILSETGGDRIEARKRWEAEEFDKDDKRNEYKEIEEDGDATRKAEPTRKEMEEDKVTRLVENIRIYLEKKIKVLERSNIYKQKEKIKETKDLMNILKELDGIESINEFVKDAFNKSKIAHKHFNYTINRIQNGELSRKEAIQELVAMQDFANRYSIINEIQKADVLKFFSTPVDIEAMSARDEKTLTPQEMLSFTKSVTDNIKTKFIAEGIPLMADFLLDYKPMGVDERIKKEVYQLQQKIEVIKNNPKNSPEFIAKKTEEIQQRIDTILNFTLDKKSMIEVLEKATKDTTIFDYLTAPLISSPDSALGLFARAVKTEMETARLEDIALRKRAAKAFNEYKASVPALMRDNPAKFNEGLYETISVPRTDPETGEYVRTNEGRIILDKRVAFVQKYDQSKFHKEKAKFFESIGKKPDNLTDAREWFAKVTAWFDANTIPKPKEQIREILKQKELEKNRGLLTEDEYQDWRRENLKVDENGKIIGYKYGKAGELVMPADKYINAKWNALYDASGNPLNPKGKYHKFLVEEYLKSQENLPDIQKPGYVIPSIEKTDGERLLAKGIVDLAKNRATELVKVKAYDVEYGVDLGLGEEGNKFLPVYFVQPMAEGDISLNLMRSVLMFGSMSNNYNAMNGIYNEINLFKEIIGDREIAETNTKGIPIVDSIAKRLGYDRYLKTHGSNFSSRRVNDFIDMVVYGESKARFEVAGIAVDKIIDKMMNFSAISTLSLDLLKGMNNNLQGNLQLLIEAASGEFFDMKSWTRGKKDYWTTIPQMLSDFGKFTPESLMGQIIEQYDPMQGEYKDQFGKVVTGSVANKLFSTDTIFFNLHFGEHEIQVSTLFAMLNSRTVKDNESGQEISLMEAYKKYGVDEIKNKTDFTEEMRLDVQNKIHALNKRMHGIYNNFDKSVAQKHTLGRLALMYRKFLVPSYTRRFKKLGMDQELGAMTEGFYRTFWNAFAKDLITFKAGIGTQWSNLSDFEKAQVRRTMTEIGFILALSMLIWGLLMLVDDDDEEETKKSYGYNFLFYQAIRLRSETQQYLPGLGFKDAYRIVKSPTAMTSTVDNFIRFTDQFLFTWDDEKLSYKRKTGIWEKGDNKSWAYFLKLIGYTGNNITPDQAVKNFQAALNK
jgi:hypothetical protein